MSPQEYERPFANTSTIAISETASCAVVRPSEGSRWPMDTSDRPHQRDRSSSIAAKEPSRVLRPRSNIKRPSKCVETIVRARPTRVSPAQTLGRSKSHEERTEFVPREDDNETLWIVEKIIAENTRSFKVIWAGLDLSTNRPWKPSWVRKYDCTPDLVAEWRNTQVSGLSGMSEFLIAPSFS
jgi:hypothetical protein